MTMTAPINTAMHSLSTLANRESWLTQLAGLAIPHMQDSAKLAFGRWRVTCGFPSSGGMLGRRKSRIGECWNPRASMDQTAEVLISPVLAKPGDVSHVLVHELIHVALPGAGHGKPFQAAAKRLGLLKPYTATTPGEAFWPWMRPLLDQLGPYPHAQLLAIQVEGAPKPQTNRYFKAACAACGYSVRITRKWHEAVGAPHCPDHGEMQLEVSGSVGQEDSAEAAEDCITRASTFLYNKKKHLPNSVSVQLCYDYLPRLKVARGGV
jgi:hypothetical protein